MSTTKDIEALTRRIMRLETYQSRVNLRTVYPHSPRVLQIIGGNLTAGVDMIQYNATDPTLTQTYNPDVDTVYPAGLGRAWLMGGTGQQLQRVLVRNDFSGAALPVLGGWVFATGGHRTLTTTSGAILTVYTLTWAV